MALGAISAFNRTTVDELLQCGSRMTTDGGKLKCSRKPCFNSTLFKINRTRTTLGLKKDLRDRKPLLHIHVSALTEERNGPEQATHTQTQVSHP